MHFLRRATITRYSDYNQTLPKYPPEILNRYPQRSDSPVS